MKKKTEKRTRRRRRNEETDALQFRRHVFNRPGFCPNKHVTKRVPPAHEIRAHDPCDTAAC